MGEAMVSSFTANLPLPRGGTVEEAAEAHLYLMQQHLCDRPGSAGRRRGQLSLSGGSAMRILRRMTTGWGRGAKLRFKTPTAG
jgi:hypothetical protein